MTTTVILKTHNWPVQVTTTDVQDYEHGGKRVVGETTTTEEVPPNSEATFHITNTRSIAFDELPIPPQPIPAEKQVEEAAAA